MNRIVFIICVLCFSITSFAQSLGFMGIPFGTNIDKFIDLLSDKGFTYLPYISNLGESHDTYYFDGIFAGNNARLSVITTPKSKLVQAVSVCLVNYDQAISNASDDEIEEKYKDIQKQLRKKYANAKVYYQNNYSYFVKSTIYKAKNWSVCVSIQSHNDEDIGLYLLYGDFTLQSKAEKEKLEDY